VFAERHSANKKFAKDNQFLKSQHPQHVDPKA
jgi:hypothetical protein